MTSVSAKDFVNNYYDQIGTYKQIAQYYKDTISGKEIEPYLMDRYHFYICVDVVQRFNAYSNDVPDTSYIESTLTYFVNEDGLLRGVWAAPEKLNRYVDGKTLAEEIASFVML